MGRCSEVDLYFPDDDDVQRAVGELERTLPLQVRRNPVRTPPLTRATTSQAFLLCQLLALDECDAVLAVGGRGTVDLLLKLAEAKGKPIVPVLAFGGAAAEYYRNNRSQFRHQFEELSSRQGAEAVVRSVAPVAVRPGSLAATEVFISYSRRNVEHADVVENVLHRRGVGAPFRDEEALGAGDDWAVEINEALDRAHVFIALWSAHFACSPHCFHEMEQALLRKDPQSIWLFALDSTRMTFPQARRLHLLPGQSREELTSSLEAALRRYKEAL